MGNISIKDFKNLINDKNTDFQVVDVRSRVEWDAGHIEDRRVINVDINNLFFNSSQIAKDKDVYLICESGGRSSLAQKFLEVKGYRAFDVLGGMSEYRKLK